MRMELSEGFINLSSEKRKGGVLNMVYLRCKGSHRKMGGGEEKEGNV